jgi:hypothetical protein
MACDSRLTFGNEFYTVSDKIMRIGEEIVGCAGDTDAIFKFLEWFRVKGPMPEMDGEKRFEAIVLNRKGIHIYVNSFYPMTIRERFYTGGSGGMAAKAALLCGKTPSEAVRIAIQCDNNSGPPVLTLSLD